MKLITFCLNYHVRGESIVHAVFWCQLINYIVVAVTFWCSFMSLFITWNIQNWSRKKMKSVRSTRKIKISMKMLSDIKACEPENFVGIKARMEKTSMKIKMHLPHGKNNPLKIALIMENFFMTKKSARSHCIFCYSDESAYQQELWS